MISFPFKVYDAEDKQGCAAKLANALQAYGRKVWAGLIPDYPEKCHELMAQPNKAGWAIHNYRSNKARQGQNADWLVILAHAKSILPGSPHH